MPHLSSASRRPSAVLRYELDLGGPGASAEHSAPLRRSSRKQTARRKAIYEELHPETRPGENQRTRLRQFGEATSDRFTAETASSTGKSERVVQRDHGDTGSAQSSGSPARHPRWIAPTPANVPVLGACFEPARRDSYIAIFLRLNIISDYRHLPYRWKSDK